MNVYKDLLTKKDALTAVRNQLFAKMIDIEINLEVTKVKRDAEKVLKDKADIEQTLKQIQKDYDMLNRHVSMIEKMIVGESQTDPNV